MLSRTVYKKINVALRASVKTKPAFAISTTKFSTKSENASDSSNHKLNPTFAFLSLLGVFGVSVAHFQTLNDSEINQTVIQSNLPTFSRKEIEQHNTLEKGVWITYRENVYDVSKFIANHPGGTEKLMSVAGKDIASSWNIYQHHKSSSLALELLEEMKIGLVSPEDVIIVSDAPNVAKFSNKPIYDVIIVGAGLSGLQCGSALVNKYGVNQQNILVLEAQDYVGGRVKQVTEFIKGTKIEVGAEFLHGGGTELTKFAREHDEPLREIYCWAHGDGGPLPEPEDNGYGLYYIAADKKEPHSNPSVIRHDNLPYAYKSEEVQLNSKDRLLRYDDTDPDFVRLNKLLWELCDLNEDDFDESLSFYDYLLSKELNPNMLRMAAAGFANTLCSNSHELSLKQAVKWSRLWHAEEPTDPGAEDGDYTFKNSYSCLVDFLKKDLQIELNTPIAHILYPNSFVEGEFGENVCAKGSKGQEEDAEEEGTTSVSPVKSTMAEVAEEFENWVAAGSVFPAHKSSNHTNNSNCTSGKCGVRKVSNDTEQDSVVEVVNSNISDVSAKFEEWQATRNNTTPAATAASTSTVVCTTGQCHISKGNNTPAGKLTTEEIESLYPGSVENDLIVLTTKDGVEYRAKKVVVTASPHVINTKLIKFTPPLPAEIADAFDYTLMNNVTKVIMKFSKPVWPKDLHGMIMVDDDFLLPEVWFRNVGDEVDADEPATAYAVGFTTAKYAERIKNMTQEEVLKQSVAQLEKIFSQLEQRHMAGEEPEHGEAPASLPKASEAYLGGMFWDWQPSHHPYIGGGYCSPRAGKPITSGDILSKPYGRSMFFAGEATNDRPGATAHSALETGLRAADQVATALKKA